MFPPPFPGEKVAGVLVGGLVGRIAVGVVDVGIILVGGVYQRIIKNKTTILKEKGPGNQTPNVPNGQPNGTPSNVSPPKVRSAYDILMPGGQKVGTPGSQGVQRVKGDLKDAQKMFDELAAGGKDVTPPNYSGKLFELPNGARVGLRPVSHSRDKSPTLNVTFPDIKFNKIHFVK
ncbi:MAG: hypothetical protein WCO91_08695 [Gemmataceae bacterium]